MAENEKNPYLGETFEDRDSRSRGRRVKVIDVAVEGRDAHSTRYLVEVVLNVGASATIGRKYKMLGRTLTAHYKKVSH